MAVFLVVRLPSRLKSLEALEYMQSNDFSFRISSNSSLLKLLKSLEGAEGGFSAILDLSDEFKLGDEEKQLIQQFIATEVKEEVESDVEHQLKNNVNATEVKEEVESDVEQDDVRTTEERCSDGTEASFSLASQIQPAVVSTVTEQGVQDAQAEPVLKEAGLEMEEHGGQNFLGEKEADGQGIERGDGREMAADDLLEPADADDSMMSIDPIHNDDSLVFDAAFDEDFPELEEKVVDEDIENNENMEDFEEEEEELVEEQEHEDNEANEDVDDNTEESDESSDEDVATEDMDEEETKSSKKKDFIKAPDNTVARLLFTCLVKNCPSSYKKFKKLEEHMEIHVDEQDFYCDVCKKSFSSKEDAMMHIRRRLDKECCECGKKLPLPNRLLRHLRSHTGEKPFVCQTCGRGFTLVSGLTFHMLTHTGEKRFSCGHCKKRFARKQHLDVHQRTHTGERPFQCDHCDFKSNDGSILRRHKKIHTREKPYSCKFCEKRCSRIDDIKRHELTHTREKAHECSHCGKRFSQRCTLKKHIRLHTGEKPYSCKECDKKFTESGHLKSHMKRMHKS